MSFLAISLLLSNSKSTRTMLAIFFMLSKRTLENISNLLVFENPKTFIFGKGSSLQ